MNAHSVVELVTPATRAVNGGFREDVLQGLRRHPKCIPCKYLYDETGSRLFEQICELEEYYPTRTENGILRRHIGDIVALCGQNCLLVELGSGSSSKTRLLLDYLPAPAAYIPIDIAQEQLDAAANALAERYPGLEILPICADYHDALHLPKPRRNQRRTVLFFPGSTIGNLEPTEAGQFLHRLRRMTKTGDALLIGVDLRKARTLLEPAYNDSRGVTASFNLNLLCRINRELGANFDLEGFKHQAIYNAVQSRVEMHLVSLHPQTVTMGGQDFPFQAEEMIVTEHSYKYSIADFSRIAERAGYTVREYWCDPRKWFGVFFLI